MKNDDNENNENRNEKGNNEIMWNKENERK